MASRKSPKQLAGDAQAVAFAGDVQRKLSIWRVSLGIIILFLVIAISTYGAKSVIISRLTPRNEPWFASYVDVTATPFFEFQQMGSSNSKDAVLSFVVASPNSPCTPTWGGVYTLTQAEGDLSLDTRIARLQQQGGSVAVSFGGKNNQELALACTNPSKLLAAYQQVVNRYNLNTIDLDIEGQDLNNSAAGLRRAQTIAKLQKQQRSAGKNLAVWLTLPVSSQGLTEAGTTAVSQMLSSGVDLAGVNVMVMDFGHLSTLKNTLLQSQGMLVASESALTQTARQLGILYQRAHIHLNTAAIWAKLGATPMIGQNDFADEIFTLADARGLNKFALSHGIGRMSMWSANRDLTCGSNYVYTSVVSDSCSGVNQHGQSFASLLGAGFKGSISLSSGFKTVAQPLSSTAIAPDNPATSPYQIWSPQGTYLEGTKVVWHHNIYQAKWWTQGNVPDDPVLQTWQTPWELIGPVLPGQKPIPQPTLPTGTYPDWSGTSIYTTGQRVLFNGVPYQAKWWNQGQSPAASSSNPDSSPWVPLTQAQINAVMAKLQA
jgi:chitinase